MNTRGDDAGNGVFCMMYVIAFVALVIAAIVGALW